MWKEATDSVAEAFGGSKSQRFKERVYKQWTAQRGILVLHLEAGDAENDVCGESEEEDNCQCCLRDRFNIRFYKTPNC